MQIKKSAAIAKVSKADYKAEVMRRMMADRATPHLHMKRCLEERWGLDAYHQKISNIS